jgi:hypothetical protein
MLMHGVETAISGVLLIGVQIERYQRDFQGKSTVPRLLIAVGLPNI